jgi:amidohydrolase
LHLSTRFPVGRVEVPLGLAMAAADVFELIVRGTGGHGAVAQASGDPIVAATHLLMELQHLPANNAPAEPALLSIGQICAGTTFNVIPDEAMMYGSIRTVARNSREVLLERLRLCAERVASAHGASAELRLRSSCPTLVNEAEASAMVCRCAGDALGPDQVSAGPLVMASDDMSLFLKRWPGCYFRVGAGRSSGESPPHHSPLFDIDERALAVGLHVACAVVTVALSSPTV